MRGWGMMIRFTWTWNNVTESSSIRTLTPSSFPAFFGVPGGVLLLAPHSPGLPLRLRESIWELRASEPSLFIVPSAILSHCQSWRVRLPARTDWCHWEHWLTNHYDEVAETRESWSQLNLGGLKEKNIIGCYYSKQKQGTGSDIYIYLYENISHFSNLSKHNRNILTFPRQSRSSSSSPVPSPGVTRA